jgi:hypothetical protein
VKPVSRADSRTGRALNRLGWLSLVLACSSCSWLVDPDGKAARCSTEDDATPCPNGFECREERCVEACGTEVCGNGKDDDCDDVVDERIAGATDRCGDMEDNDCDGKVDEDTDSARTEACGNAIDDDCDGKVDELPDSERPEACGNHADDDCDGNTDEGHDQDADGNQWCGDTRTPEGMQLVDCDDYDANVHPGAEERCDGADNDCDGTIDEAEASSLCAAGEECVAQRCVVPSCAVEGSSEECEPDEMCNLATGKCVPRGCSDEECAALGQYCDITSGQCRVDRRNNGDECAADGDCKSGSCIDAAALRLVSAEARVCGQACCNDSECTEGQRCFVSGSGARSCLPASLAPDPGGAELCTNDAQCDAANAVCALEPGQRITGPGPQPRNDLISTVCSTPVGTAFPAGANCLQHPDCASNACVFNPFDPFYDVCSAICRTTEDCAAVEAEARADGPSNAHSYCRFLEATAGLTDGDYVTACVIDRGEAGTGAFGARCSSGLDCLDGACVGAGSTSTGYCSPTCCSDSQCPALDGTATFCRPIAFGDHYEMRCVR